jgi:hypothetical protein
MLLLLLLLLLTFACGRIATAGYSSMTDLSLWQLRSNTARASSSFITSLVKQLRLHFVN